MFWIITIIIILSLWTIFSIYLIIRITNNSSSIIDEEIGLQEETRRRLGELMKYLKTLKDSNVTVANDPLVSEVYRLSCGMYDYLDTVYFKKEEETPESEIQSETMNSSSG
jgi:hypothetical protein